MNQIKWIMGDQFEWVTCGIKMNHIYKSHMKMNKSFKRITLGEN